MDCRQGIALSGFPRYETHGTSITYCSLKQTRAFVGESHMIDVAVAHAMMKSLPGIAPLSRIQREGGVKMKWGSYRHGYGLRVSCSPSGVTQRSISWATEWLQCSTTSNILILEYFPLSTDMPTVGPFWAKTLGKYQTSEIRLSVFVVH